MTLSREDAPISAHQSTPSDTAVPRRRVWRRYIPALLLGLFVIAMIRPGLGFRTWAWDFTEPGRFRGDINRNFVFGAKALDNGYLNLYEDDIRDQPSRGWKLDYTPLRLLTFETWAAWTRRTHPGASQWEDSYSAPLINYYTTLEWLAAVAALLIVRHWLIECARADQPFAPDVSPWTGFVRAMLAFTLLWFDPGVAIIAHGWPSPNMWVIPLYLWTALFCLWDCWFVAGLVMGIGAMMQGQQMLVAPIFILWPLFAGRPVRAMRWVCGFAFAFIGITSGWMLSVRPDLQSQVRFVNWRAVSWLVASLLMLLLLALHRQFPWRYRRVWWLVPAGLAVVVINVPAWAIGDRWIIGATMLLSVGMIAALWQFGWTTKRYLLPLATAGLLAGCMPLFGATTAWWDIGFAYGAERFPNVGGTLANNLGAILHFNFNWQDIHETCFAIAPGTWFNWGSESIAVNNRQVLLTIYMLFFVAGAFALARQWRRRGRNLLIALVLPWVLFFTLMPQMSPRYAVFAAGIGAICIGRSAGMSLLVLYFSALTVEQTSLCMMFGNRVGGDHFNALFNGEMRDLFERINCPGPSWATLIAAGVFMWMSLTGAPRRSANSSAEIDSPGPGTLPQSPAPA